MSVLAELRDYEKRVIERLNELKPLVDEYQELEQLASKLGLEREAAASSSATAAKPKPARRSGRASTSRRKAAAKPSGGRRTPGRRPQRKEQVLKFVTERPGITVPDIAKEIGVDPTGLYRVVRQLEREGSVTKSGTQLRPKG